MHLVKHHGGTSSPRKFSADVAAYFGRGISLAIGAECYYQSIGPLDYLGRCNVGKTRGKVCRSDLVIPAVPLPGEPDSGFGPRALLLLLKLRSGSQKNTFSYLHTTSEVASGALQSVHLLYGLQ